jgi:hypothetical protein
MSVRKRSFHKKEEKVDLEDQRNAAQLFSNCNNRLTECRILDLIGLVDSLLTTLHFVQNKFEISFHFSLITFHVKYHLSHCTKEISNAQRVLATLDLTSTVSNKFRSSPSSTHVVNTNGGQSLPANINYSLQK